MSWGQRRIGQGRELGVNDVNVVLKYKVLKS